MSADTEAARERLEVSRQSGDGMYSARYAEWRVLADRDLEAHMAPYRAMSKVDRDKIQVEALRVVGRMVDEWLSLREAIRMTR